MSRHRSSNRTQAWILAAILAALGSATAEAGFRIEKSLKLAPGGKLVVTTDAGSVSITGSSRDGAEVIVTSKSDDLESRFDFRFEELAGEVHVTARKKDGVSSWLGIFGSSPHFEIRVPTRTMVAVKTAGGSIKTTSLDGEARLATSGGSISVTKQGGKVEAKTSGGSIEVREVQGDVVLDTSGGSIRIARVTGDLEVSTSGGSIAIDEAGGRVVAETSGGSISASFARGNQRGGSLETSGGGIDVRVDPDVNLSIDASASGGKVVSDLPVKVKGEIRRTSLVGTLGAGGAPLTLQTSGGSVRITGLQGLAER